MFLDHLLTNFAEEGPSLLHLHRVHMSLKLLSVLHHLNTISPVEHISAVCHNRLKSLLVHLSFNCNRHSICCRLLNIRLSVGFEFGSLGLQCKVFDHDRCHLILMLVILVAKKWVVDSCTHGVGVNHRR